MTTRVPQNMIGLSPSGGDDTARIHAALAAYDTVELTAGTFYANVNMAGMRGKTLRGAGRYSTFLKNWGAGAAITLSNASADCQLIRIADMAIVNRDKAVYTSTDGILITGGEDFQQEFNAFENLWIQDFRYGVHVTARLIWSNFDNVTFISNGTGMYWAPGLANISQVVVRNSCFTNNTDYGFYAVKDTDSTISGVHFDTCTFQLSGLNGVRVAGSASGLAGWVFTSCYTEENATALTTGSTNPRKANFYFDADVIAGLVFNGCSIYGGMLGGDPDWHIYVKSGGAAASGHIGACRPGTALLGFANVPGGFSVAHQIGGTTTVTKAAGSISFSALVEEAASTAVLTLTGCTTSPTGTLRAVKQGKQVTIYLPTITATSNTTAATLTGLPAALYPTRDQSVLCRVSNNGAVVLGLFQINTAGLITLAADVGGGAFTAANTKGIQLQTLTYSVD